MLKKIFATLLLLSGVLHAEEGLGEFLTHHISNSHEWHPIPWITVHLPTGWMIGGVDVSPSQHVLGVESPGAPSPYGLLRLRQAVDVVAERPQRADLAVSR